jgi:hypothetical protein
MIARAKLQELTVSSLNIGPLVGLKIGAMARELSIGLSAETL